MRQIRAGRLSTGRWVPTVPVSLLFFVFAFVVSGVSAEPPAKEGPPKGSPSDRTYSVRHLSASGVDIDGSLEETVWREANLLTDVQLPWNEDTPPETRFRAFYGSNGFFFSFRVEDEDIVMRETVTDEKDIIHEDRVELFFARSPALETYYGLEMDPGGLALTYRSTYYRNSDIDWDLPDMTLRGRTRSDGYTVEGRIPLSFFVRNRLFSGPDSSRVLTGVFRAEFSHGEGDDLLRRWMTWIDPETEGADFHRPRAFGWFVFE